MKVHVLVAEDLGPYDVIFGMDYLHRYGIDLKFSSGTIEWDGISTPMREPGYWTDE